MINQKDIDFAFRKNWPSCIINDKLKGMDVVKLNKKGLPPGQPERYRGGFAVAYHVKKGQIFDSALRIWTLKIDDIKDRSKRICEYLGTIKSPKEYFYGYEYIESALIISGEKVDVVLMDWIKGQTLDKFIESDRDKPNNLRKVADNCMELFKWMRSNNISHGDLQHGNIIVDSKLNVHLCDYDSLCIPGMEGMALVTTGLSGYQHPLRVNGRNQKMSFDDDFFSEVVIYAGLLTLAENPNLWKHKDNDAQYLLLSAEVDFKAIREGKTTPIVEEINKIKDEKVKKCNQLLLQNIKCNNLSEIKTFDEVINVGFSNTASTFGKNKSTELDLDKPKQNLGESSSLPKQIQQQSNVVFVRSPKKDLGVCPHCNHKLRVSDILYCNFCGGKISKPFPF